MRRVPDDGLLAFYPPSVSAKLLPSCLGINRAISPRDENHRRVADRIRDGGFIAETQGRRGGRSAACWAIVNQRAMISGTAEVAETA